MNPVATERIETAYRERFRTSAKLYERGKALFPDGVTHDSRYLKPFPIYIDRALGSRKFDLDDNEIIDYWGGHGALLLGHGHPAVVEAVRKQMERGTHPGACHELELQWGERVRSLVPSAEKLRFTNSGTEATLMAIRVARIMSGKTKVLKFAGHFHGWHDQVIPAAEPPHDVDSYAVPGVTPGVFGDLVIVPPNNLDAVERAIDEHDPACVIHEGNGARWGTVLARADFLQGLRQLTKDRGVTFILDEVITGFRVDPCGFQGYCGITPDLSTFAKVLAGGLPGGCLAGRADLMQALSFENAGPKKMKHPGTFNGNPLSAAAGMAALDVVATGEPCKTANLRAKQLRAGLNGVFADQNVPWVAYGDFSTVKIHPEYTGPRPTDDDFIPFGNDYLKLDRKFDPALSHAFRCALLLSGIDWMGWGGNVSAAHREIDIAQTVSGFAQAMERLKGDGYVRAIG